MAFIPPTLARHDASRQGAAGSADVVWAKTFGGGIRLERRRVAVAIGVDRSGNVLITRSFDGGIDFGPGPLRGPGHDVRRSLGALKRRAGDNAG